MANYNYSITSKELTIKSRLEGKEQINSRELELLGGRGIRGVMKVQKGLFGKLTFTAPPARQLKGYLMEGLTREEFASVVAQFVRVLGELDGYGLPMRNLELNVDSVFISPNTRELFFVYRPVNNKLAGGNVNAFIRMLIEYATFTSYQDRVYVSELESVLRDIEQSPLKTISDYVRKLDKPTYDRELADMDRARARMYAASGADSSETEDYSDDSSSTSYGYEDSAATDFFENSYDEATSMDYESVPVQQSFGEENRQRSEQYEQYPNRDFNRGGYDDYESTRTTVDDGEAETDFYGNGSQSNNGNQYEPSREAADAEMATGIWEDPANKEDNKKPDPAPSYEPQMPQGNLGNQGSYNDMYRPDQPQPSEDTDSPTGIWDEPPAPSSNQSGYEDPYQEPLENEDYQTGFWDESTETDAATGFWNKPPASAPRPAPRPSPVNRQSTRVQAKLYRISSGEVFAIRQDEVLIGKDRYGADIHVEGNPAVSRRHAVISLHDGRFYITDVGSLNHTFVNGREIRPNQITEITDGTRLCLADENFIFRIN